MCSKVRIEPSFGWKIATLTSQYNLRRQVAFSGLYAKMKEEPSR